MVPIEPELTQIIADVSQRLTMAAAWPASAPTDGQSDRDWRAGVAALRAQHDAVALEASRLCPALPAPRTPCDLDVTYVSVPVGSGLVQSAKLHRPRGGRADRPAVLLLHGGGWWMAGGPVAFELGDPICRLLASELDAVVLNVDYRLAPEHRYPTALDDAEAAVDWLHASATTLGIDTGAIAVFGISSGGNLAAALARRLRGTDRALRLQMLHVPALDLTFSSPSCLADPPWREHGDVLRSYYVPDHCDPLDPCISPALADDFTGLPPAVVVTGRFDPLRDDGARYVDGLRGAGVDGVLLEYPMTHGIATADVTARWLVDVVAHAAPFLTS